MWRLENNGGAAVLFQTRMNITGNVVFEGNNAANGGAVTLEDESFVCTFSFYMCILTITTTTLQCSWIYTVVQSVLSLITEQNHCGALLVKNPSSQDVESIFNTNCFIQYNEMERPNEILTQTNGWESCIQSLNSYRNLSNMQHTNISFVNNTALLLVLQSMHMIFSMHTDMSRWQSHSIQSFNLCGVTTISVSVSALVHWEKENVGKKEEKREGRERW